MRRFHVCSVIPPHILEHTAQHAASADARRSARRTLAVTARLAGQRDILARFLPMEAGNVIKQRTVCNCAGRERLPGQAVLHEGDAPDPIEATFTEAYNGSGTTWDLYANAFGRNSLDDAGLPLLSSCHYGRDYDNAFWNGAQMCYGDGDGVLFGSFTKIIDVIGHELTHGVTQFSANLTYEGQAGALNESMSDCFGSMVKQFSFGQAADKADWIIGQGIFAPGINGVGIRSMKAPGTAYDDPQLGKDPQPAHMKDYVNTDDDNGGVHINSGIPNRAFYLASMRMGGNTWNKAGAVWYTALTRHLPPDADFAAAARATVLVATEMYGENSPEMQAVASAWKDVGLPVS